jgi:hypothetical protein
MMMMMMPPAKLELPFPEHMCLLLCLWIQQSYRLVAKVLGSEVHHGVDKSKAKTRLV